MSETNKLNETVTSNNEENISNLVSLETAKNNNLEFIKALIENIKKILKELMDKFSGKATVYEAIKKVEKHIDQIAEQCEENSEVALQTVEALHELTNKIYGKLNDYESGNLTEEQLDKDIDALTNEFKKATNYTNTLGNKDELNNIFKNLNLTKTHLLYNEEESSFVISDDSKTYFLILSNTGVNNNIVIKCHEIELTQDTLVANNYVDKGILDSENTISDMLTKMNEIADVPEIKKVIEKLNSEKNVNTTKLEKLNSMKSYIETAKKIKTNDEHNITTCFENGIFKAFSPDTNKMIVLEKSKDKISAQLYILDDNFKPNEENYKNYPTENCKSIGECFKAIEENGEVNVRFRFDDDNTIRRIFETEDTKKYLEVVGGLATIDINRFLGIIDDAEFKPVKIDEEHSEKLQNIAKQMRNEIGEDYHIDYINRNTTGTYIKATPKNEALSYRSSYITFKEDAKFDSIWARTDDGKLRQVIRGDAVLRNAHAKEKTFTDVNRAFKHASDNTDKKIIKEKQIGRE